MHTELIPYFDLDTSLEGFAAYPGKSTYPLVILCHGWSGRDPYICEKAEFLATRDYVGFALDLYGKGVLGKSREENSALKKPFLEDRRLLRRRLLASLSAAIDLPHVDPKQIAVIGFGFGGLAALDLAQSGAAIQGSVSVYGHFDPLPDSKMHHPIRGRVLILHGYEDPISPLEGLLEFENELSVAKVDWQTHLYSHTLHAFTNPSAAQSSHATLYNPKSAHRAWLAIENFLQDCFNHP